MGNDSKYLIEIVHIKSSTQCLVSNKYSKTLNTISVILIIVIIIRSKINNHRLSGLKDFLKAGKFRHTLDASDSSIIPPPPEIIPNLCLVTSNDRELSVS